MGLLIQLVTIKNFYNYARIEKSFFTPHYISLMMYFYQLPSGKKNRETISELFKDILKQYSIAESKMFLKKIYCQITVMVFWIERKVIFYQKMFPNNKII